MIRGTKFCDPSLECDTHVESDFYVSRVQPDRVVLCCHCAGTMHNSLVELHTHLKAPEGPYSVVLPICKACIESGCHIIVRHARQNATAKQARLDDERARGGPLVKMALLLALLVMRKHKYSKKRSRINLKLHRADPGAILGMLAPCMHCFIIFYT